MANKIVVRDRECKQCGKRPITGYKYCSDACLHKHTYARKAARPGFAERNREANRAHLDRRYGPKVGGRRKRIDPHPCTVCGILTQRPKCCSVACTRKTENARELNYRNTAARRARIRSARIERVDRMRVFERDGWLCHLCGKKTRKDKLGTLHPLAPEMDHIVPLIRGGEHSYANTACSCKRCNARKGTKIVGQPSLLSA